MGYVKDVVGIFIALIGIVLGHEIPGMTGQQKKAEVRLKIKEILAAPGGIDFPQMLAPVQDWILDLFIDMVVLLMNRTGFFVRSSAPSPQQ